MHGGEQAIRSPEGIIHTSAMGLVDDKPGSVPAAQVDKLVNRSSVAFHTEYAFNDNNFFAGSRIFAPHRIFQIVQIPVREDHFSRARQPNAVDEACVIGGIGKDRIARSEDRAEQSYVGGVP